jgi:WD40 repeat protein
MVETRSDKRRRILEETVPPAIPTELWMKIADFLPRHDFNSLVATCKELHAASKLPSVTLKWPNNVKLFSGIGNLNNPVFSPDGKTLVVVDHYLRLWDIRKGEVPGFDMVPGFEDIVPEYIDMPMDQTLLIGFSPDGRFLAVTPPSITEGLWLFTLGNDGFDPEHYQHIPSPPGVVGFYDIVWAPDSMSFTSMGSSIPELEDEMDPYNGMRSEWDLVDGHYFTQSGSSTVDLLANRLRELDSLNFYASQPINHCRWRPFVSLLKSAYFIGLCGSKKK